MPNKKSKEMRRMDMIKIGPAEEDIPTDVWDDFRTEVVGIFISSSKKIIRGLQFQYLENGVVVNGHKHGEFTGKSSTTVKLNYPSEYLTEINGWINTSSGGCFSGIKPHVIGLEFHTNVRKHGPFGYPDHYGQTFKFSFEHGRFGGFHGRISGKGYVSAIGVYLKPPTPEMLRGSADDNDKLADNFEDTREVGMINIYPDRKDLDIPIWDEDQQKKYGDHNKFQY